MFFKKQAFIFTLDSSVPFGTYFSFYFVTFYTMPKTLHELEQNALEEFQSKFFEGDGGTDDDEATDLISEIVDNQMPIYIYEVLEVAMSNFRLICDSPENYD